MLSYLWFPFMVIPLFAGFDRLPNSLLEASTDLGAKAGRTFTSVVLPQMVPSLVAGSIFTFSLTLGDFYMNRIVGGTTEFIGNVVYRQFSVDLPFAAAYAVVPIVDHGRSTCSRSAAPARWTSCSDVPLVVLPLDAAAASPRSCSWCSTRRSSTSPGSAREHGAATTRGRRRASRSSGGRRRSTSRAHATALLHSVQTGLAATAIAPRARHARRVRAHPHPLLRSQHGEPVHRAADRAARHRDRHRAALGLPAGRDRPVVHHARGRARHVLRRDRLQQRGGAAAAALAPTVRRGVGRPRCRRLADVPARHLPADADRAGGRRAARLRAVASTRSS